MSQLKRTNIYLSEPDSEAIKKLANRHGVSSSEMIRRGISDFIRRERGVEGWGREAEESAAVSNKTSHGRK